MTYRNSEGYADPTAGEALGRIARDNRRAAREIKRLKARETYERLCGQLKRLADENGFEFPGDIWLRDKKTGFIYKNK